MTYYDTIEEDLKRAKDILERGKAEPPGLSMPEHVSFGGTIYGADIYAAYKLLESFVERIERREADIADQMFRLIALGQSNIQLGDDLSKAKSALDEQQKEMARLQRQVEFQRTSMSNQYKRIQELQDAVLRTGSRIREEIGPAMGGGGSLAMTLALDEGVGGGGGNLHDDRLADIGGGGGSSDIAGGGESGGGGGGSEY